MGRVVKDRPITTRTGRAKLKVSKVPYWRALDHGSHIGYRKNKNGGVWLARHRRTDRAYVTTTIGKADDNDKLPANGRTILDYSQAQRKAAKWCQQQEREESGNTGGVYTVADALTEYLDWYKVNRKAFSEVQRKVRRDIVPSLGSKAVARVTAREIREWRDALASSPRGVRPPQYGEAKCLPAPKTADEKRKRKHTADKALTILKAALNHAFTDREGDGAIPSDAAWRKVKPFRNVDQPVVRYLKDDECIRLVNACDSDFRALVLGALHSACRYGELVRMKVRDFNGDAGKVTVGEAKGGRPRHATLSAEGVGFFSRQCMGKAANALIFVRSDGKPWATSHQIRRMRDAAQKAKISPVPSFHVLRHTHASQLAMRGVPLPVIAAQLGHADTRLCERHYAHMSPDFVSQTLRANIPELGLDQLDNVVALTRA